MLAIGVKDSPYKHDGQSSRLELMAVGEVMADVESPLNLSTERAFAHWARGWLTLDELFRHLAESD